MAGSVRQEEKMRLFLFCCQLNCCNLTEARGNCCVDEVRVCWYVLVFVWMTVSSNRRKIGCSETKAYCLCPHTAQTCTCRYNNTICNTLLNQCILRADRYTCRAKTTDLACYSLKQIKLNKQIVVMRLKAGASDALLTHLKAQRWNKILWPKFTILYNNII